MSDGVHQDQPIRTAGTALEAAEAAVIMIHGRGATAESILGMAEELPDEGVAFLAPQAARNTWYPQSFLSPIKDNEPWLSSALERVGEVVEQIGDAGVPAERTLLMGFSQGACLSSEYVARNAREYGGLAALSGGLIGPEGTDFSYEGSLSGTPAFLGCSDTDPHIPEERVHETTRVLEELGADVDERIYPGMAHTVNEDELDAVADLVAGLTH